VTRRGRDLDIYSFQFITLYAQPTADSKNERETHSFRTFRTINLLQQKRNSLWHGIIGKKSSQNQCPAFANIAVGNFRVDSSPFPSSYTSRWRLRSVHSSPTLKNSELSSICTKLETLNAYYSYGKDAAQKEIDGYTEERGLQPPQISSKVMVRSRPKMGVTDKLVFPPMNKLYSKMGSLCCSTTIKLSFLIV